MHRSPFVAGLWLAWLMGSAVAAQAPAPAPPPAPAPGTPGIYKSAAALLDALGKAAPAGFGMTTAPIADTDQYRVNIVHRPTPANAIAHPGNTELHYIIEGAGTIVTGGTIAGRGADTTIVDGVSRRVTKGDVVIIPANTAHWYKAVDSSITYLEVRFVAPVR